MEEVKSVADRRLPFIAVYGDIGNMKKIALVCEQKLVMEVEGCAKAVITNSFGGVVFCVEL